MLRHLIILILALAACRTLPAQKTNPNPLSKERIMARDRFIAARDSADYEAALRKVFTHLRADSITAALRATEEALRLRPTAPGNALLHEVRGRIFLLRDQPKAALRALDDALDLDPLRTEARLLRARTLLNLGEDARAATDCTHLLAHLAPADTAHRHEARQLRAEALVRSRAFGHAEADLDTLLRQHPHDVDAQLLLASLHCRQERWEEARLRTALLIERHPQLYEAHFLHGFIAFHLRDFETAVDDFSVALTLRPDDGMAYAARAEAHQALGHTRAARQDFEQARRKGWEGTLELGR